VTDTSASAPLGARFRLSTFGALALAGPDDGTILGTHGHHRRRLALLAVLAAAGEQGVSRDRLLLLFWPEATLARARHSLDQLLYAIRRTLAEDVFAGVNPVRLDAGVVASDVATFNEALARGDHATAIAVYRGPFLDGFYLDDAPEFERWVETERARLAERRADALDRSAERAAAGGDLATAVRHRRLLTETDPLSGRYAAGYIRALAAAGDHASALQFARRYEAIVARELDTRLDPAVISALEAVRARVPDAPATLSRSALVASERAGDRENVSPAPAGATAESRQQPRSRFPRSGIRVGATLAMVTLVGIATWRGLAARREPARATDGAGAAQPLGTPSIAAHELYERGNDPALLRSDSGTRVALQSFADAIALDSGYAQAWAGLARSHMRLAESDESLTWDERAASAEAAARRALALDATFAEGHATLAWVLVLRQELALALTEFERAVAIEPRDARFREWLAHHYVMLDRPAEGLAEARRAAELAPMSPSARAEVARALMESGRCDEALAQLEQVRTLRPPLLRASDIAAQCHLRARRWEEAIAELRRIEHDPQPRTTALLGFALARAGRRDEARRALATLQQRSPALPAFDIATVYAGLGEHELAVEWLDRAVRERHVVLDHVSLVTQALLPDPRVDALRRRLGLPVRAPSFVVGPT
jgi:DNA-binding SARP family transcriptional activator